MERHVYRHDTRRTDLGSSRVRAELLRHPDWQRSQWIEDRDSQNIEAEVCETHNHCGRLPGRHCRQHRGDRCSDVGAKCVGEDLPERKNTGPRQRNNERCRRRAALDCGGRHDTKTEAGGVVPEEDPIEEGRHPLQEHKGYLKSNTTY